VLLSPWSVRLDAVIVSVIPQNPLFIVKLVAVIDGKSNIVDILVVSSEYKFKVPNAATNTGRDILI
jgi:hypothetical protein